MKKLFINKKSIDWWFILIIFIYIITRIPFIPLGYGSDGDAWSVATVAKAFFATGKYESSRPPGNPLFEIINSILDTYGGWYSSNIATLSISIFLLIVFYKILNIIKVNHPKLLLILFTFFPIFWIHSADTMDYLWALLFIMLSWYFLIIKRHILAALCLGISVGFRLPGCLFVVPFSVYLYYTSQREKIFIYLIMSTVFSVISFSLPILTYGIHTFSYYTSPGSEITHLPYYLVTSIGITSSLITISGLIIYFPDILKFIREKDPIILTCISSVVIIFLLFCKVPLERAYLIPLFPFLFIIMDKFFNKRLFILFIIIAISYGFIMVEVKDEKSLDEIKIRPHLSTGLVVKDYLFRKQQMEFRRKLFPYFKEKYGNEKKYLIVAGFSLGPEQFFENNMGTAITIYDGPYKMKLVRVNGTCIDILPAGINEHWYNYFLRNSYEVIFIEGAIRISKLDYQYALDPKKVNILTIDQIENELSTNSN